MALTRAERALLDLLAPAIAAARAEWGLDLDPAVFVRHVAQHAPSATAETLARLHLGDLYLAAGCTHADRRALAVFDARFMSQVGTYIRKVDASPAIADEVQQILRTRLLAGAPAAIASYTGRGALGGWLRVAAVRALHDLLRARKSHVPIDGEHAPVLAAAGNDPELSFFKRHYARELGEAIVHAIAALPPRDRNMLRWHYSDSLSTDAIATLQHVDGSTVRRKLTALRRRLLEDVRARLTERLGLEGEDLDSVMALARSRLDLSLSSQLRRS